MITKPVTRKNAISDYTSFKSAVTLKRNNVTSKINKMSDSYYIGYYDIQTEVLYSDDFIDRISDYCFGFKSTISLICNFKDKLSDYYRRNKQI